MRYDLNYYLQLVIVCFLVIIWSLETMNIITIEDYQLDLLFYFIVIFTTLLSIVQIYQIYYMTNMVFIILIYILLLVIINITMSIKKRFF